MTAHRVTAAAVIAAAGISAGILSGCSSTADDPSAIASAALSSAAAAINNPKPPHLDPAARGLHLDFVSGNRYVWRQSGTDNLVTVDVLSPAQAASSYLASDVLNRGRTFGLRVLPPYDRNQAVMHALQAQVDRLPPK